MKMKERDEFLVFFGGLKEGKHSFSYQITDVFFEGFDYREFSNVNVHVSLLLEKGANSLSLHFKIKGTVQVLCDLSNEPYYEEIKGALDLIVKYGDVYNDEDDALLIIPHEIHHINVAQYIYEMIVLSVPLKKIHPGIKDGTLSNDILKLLKQLSPAENKSKGTDPRWDILKKLVTHK